MPVAKVAVSMPAELAEQVRESAAEGRESVSGWIAEAVRQRLRMKALDELLCLLEREDGPVDEARIAEFKREWLG